ncbi:hypothetical protein [Paenibacillus thermotolerans]|uniref:hypothetical protein n=1 Tax=Paenibacillus thermotolerans TaxID=3027807 RepID=UPI0023688F48|nr:MULTISPECIES: hypothetical protein [unclassified Paenibacillus]
MIESLFPSMDNWLIWISVNKTRIFLFAAFITIVTFYIFNHWWFKYQRIMKQVFENTNLYVKPKHEKKFPLLLSLSNRKDDVFLEFHYKLRPGMTISQFEEKKKAIESAFNREAKVFGKGNHLIIKVKKTKELSTDYSKWTLDQD